MINYKKKSFTLADIYSFQIFYHQTPVKSAHSSSKVAKISKKNKRKIDRYAVKCGEKKRKNGIDREASPTR